MLVVLVLVVVLAWVAAALPVLQFLFFYFQSWNSLQKNYICIVLKMINTVRIKLMKIDT